MTSPSKSLNDGDVTALLGSMSLHEGGGVLGDRPWHQHRGRLRDRRRTDHTPG